MQQRVLPVTLTITTLNEEHSLQDFFSTIEAQTVLPTEISLCDGGSKDRTVANIRAWHAPTHCTVIVAEHPGANIAQGRNTAISQASNEIIAVTDAGCRLEPDWLERITEPMLANADVSVVGGGYRFRTENRFERIAAAAEMRIEDIPGDVFLPSSRSVAFRKSAWASVGGYPESLSFAGEDTAFCIALQARGYRIHLRRDAIVHWRPRSSLRRYIRQHRLYGIGDGEAGNNRSVYGKIVLKYGLSLAILLLALVFPGLFVGIAAGGVLYGLRMHRIYHWREVPALVWPMSLLLISVKELSILSGFVAGVRKSAGKT